MSLFLHIRKLKYTTALFVALLAAGIPALGQPVAAFTANPVSGCAPLAVSFTDQSTGNPTSWQWDLGNGIQSTQQNPTTTYLTPGIYTVSLTVTNAAGSNTLTRTQYITVNDRPSVGFAASDSVGCFPLRVNFTDFSVAGSTSIASWEWDFGDGTGSTAQNPFHVYNAAGNYTVTLKVTNSGGCVRVLSKPQYIRVSTGVLINFANSAPQLCHPPETINFTNLSTGPGTLSHTWFFGDGGSSTLTNPSHTYTAGGSYTVTLITQSSLGCVDTAVRTFAVTINDVQSAFTGPDSICVFSNASFTNTSTPAPAASAWDFGDGTGATVANPTKAWTAPGIYPVQLINNYGTCADTVVRTIRVLALPTTDFTASDSIDCEAPFTVNFQDLTGSGTAWQWNFGDGGTSTQQNPTHTYTANGIYNVTLTVTNAGGCSFTLTKQQYIRIQRPAVAINGAPVEGCVPFTFSPTPNTVAIDGVATYLWDFGDGTTSTAQNPVHVYTTQGTYTVKLFITTNNGCTDSAVVANGVRVGTKPVADFTANPQSQCAVQPIQFTDLSVPADRWYWDFGNTVGNSTAQNPIYNYPDTGLFTITLIAWNNGCPDTAVKTNYITSLPAVARFIPAFNCVNKRQVVFTDQSVLPQSWLWDFGDGTTSTAQNPTHIFPAFGTYNVSLTVTNGSCSNTLIQQVTLINELAGFNVVDDTVCKNQQVVFVVAGTVNQANIASYFWDFGDGTSQPGGTPTGHFYTAAGFYSVKLVLTDNRGCRDSISRPNIVRVYGPTSQFTPAPLAGCRGLTVNFTDQSSTDGLHPITTRLWYYGDGQQQVQNTPPYSHTYNTAGSFTAALKVTDTYGCSDSAAFATQLYITDPDATFFSADTLACAGSAVNFTNAATGAGLSYSWTFGDGTSSTAPNPVKTYTADGDYTVTLVVTDVNGCTDSLRLVNYIKIRTVQAAFTVNDSISSCSPFEVIFTNTAVNSTARQWDFGDGTSSTQLSPTHYYNTPGTYIVKLLSTGPGGCTDSAFKTIILHPSTATLSYAPLAGCSPLTVNFTASTPGPVTFLWDLADGSTITTTTSSLTYNYLLPGNFVPKLILEDQTGCLIALTGADTIRVTRSDVNFGVNDSVFCDQATVVFSDSTTSNGSITGYQWFFGDGATSALQNPVHQYNSPGLYTITLIVRTSNGCEDTLVKPAFIKVVASPQADVTGAITACEPATLTFSGILLAADTSALTWNWSFGNSNTSQLQNPPAQQYNTAGSYPLQLIVTNSSGCTDTVTRSITINPLPATNAGNDTILCRGTPLQLNATGAATYTWQPGATLSCTSCPGPLSVTPTSQVYYVTGFTAAGCQTTDSVFVRVKNPFTLTASPLSASICRGQQVRLGASGAENYLWSPAAGLSSSTIPNPVATPDTTTTYTLLAFDTVGCFRDSVRVNITVYPYPTVNAGPDRTIPAGGSVTLSPAYSPDISSWLWTPAAGLACSNCPATAATPRSTTTYSIRVSNAGGCTATDNVTVFVTCSNENVFIPNTFSPNNDGNNDVFYPRGRGLYQVQSMRIFNRWGELVFQRTNFAANDPSAGWNGRYRGITANPDVYTYIIEVICDNSEVLPFKGNITLIQ